MPSQLLLEQIRAVPIDLQEYETLYKHFHSNPELSNQEIKTSEICAAHLSRHSEFDIHTNIDGHGLAGVFRNGQGRTILLRADMDALPILEETSLPYASQIGKESTDSPKPVMHACGHDMHMTCLLAAAETLVKLKRTWSGTLIVLFQPAEERGTGAQAMVDDGLYRKVPVPDYVLGQHVMAMRAGSVGFRSGIIMAGADSMKITVYGRGGHGSQPHRTIDPVVLASHVVVRLQGIVSREVDYGDVAVVTVGSVQAGNAENIIADHATIGVDVRSLGLDTRTKILSSIRRIVKAECDASGSTRDPLFQVTRHLPTTVNDEAMSNTLSKAFAESFGESFDPHIPITTIAEDFSVLATSQGVACAFWHFGGIEQQRWDEAKKQGRLIEDIPINHSSTFAPVIQPTMNTGIAALCVAALTFFAQDTLAKL